MNILLSTLALFYDKIFYSFLILDIIDRSPVLRNVVRAVTKNYRQLLWTAVLGIVFIYIYTTIAYYDLTVHRTFIYSNDGEYHICSTAWRCFGYILDVGLRAGGGVGDNINIPNPGKVSP
jgi:hypothetical protein